MARYRPRTREIVAAFLRRKGRATQSEIGALGGKVQLISWASLRQILTDMEAEGAVSLERVGKRLKIYVWVDRGDKL